MGKQPIFSFFVKIELLFPHTYRLTVKCILTVFIYVINFFMIFFLQFVSLDCPTQMLTLSLFFVKA